MDREMLNELLLMTEEEMDANAEEYERDRWDASQLGKVTAGRPLLYDEPMRSVSFKEPVSKIGAIDRRAASLSMSRSDYIRDLIDRDLALA